jgi:YVTN family beta-propeller protein
MVSSLLAVLDLAIVAVAAGQLRTGRRVSGLLAIAAFVAVCLLTSAQGLAQNAYITNSADNTVSVIDTASNTVTATIPVGINPFGVAVTPDGSKVYVASSFGQFGRNFSGILVIDTASNMRTPGIPVSGIPVGVAVTPDGKKVYVADSLLNSVSVIDTATNTVVGSPIPVGTSLAAFGVFIQPIIILPPDEVATTASGLAYSRVSQTFNGTVTITNISSNPISGPFSYSSQASPQA